MTMKLRFHTLDSLCEPSHVLQQAINGVLLAMPIVALNLS